uniref:Cell surface hydrophobicity-associated protein n=1 Tax=Ganoderma boninense TaxID=34458 RepID=A0A5K1K7J7_9APHY
MSKKENPMHSLIAGTTAGAVEASVLFLLPTFCPFLTERASPLTFYGHGMAGCMALVIGNAVKAGVRFVSYDHFKHALADAEGKVSPPRSLLAGLGAGMMEAIFAVTPSETIK